MTEEELKQFVEKSKHKTFFFLESPPIIARPTKVEMFFGRYYIGFDAIRMYNSDIGALRLDRECESRDFFRKVERGDVIEIDEKAFNKADKILRTAETALCALVKTYTNK